jgi:hypothetical protein
MHLFFIIQGAQARNVALTLNRLATWRPTIRLYRPQIRLSHLDQRLLI